MGQGESRRAAVRREATIRRAASIERPGRASPTGVSLGVRTAARAPSAEVLSAGSAAEALRTGGAPLGPADRAYFEPRFGRDLSHVRLHTDASAGRAASGIGALAYAHGTHIGFAPGQYRPASRAGRRMIAHELAHTLQPDAGQTIRRTCPSDPAQIPPGGSAEFEAAVDAIRALDAYRTLGRDAKATADQIIDGARGSVCPMYYITRLRLLFDTPVNPASRTTAEMRGRSVAAAAAEQTRLQDPVWAAMTGVEEAATAASGRRWRTATGEGGTQYRIDQSDLSRIYVHMKVRPQARGTGTADDVQRTISLEDGIETEAIALGYVLDVEFVSRGGPDVFDVGVNPSRWVTAGNWVGGPRPLAHEAHHLLGLEDRYDYTVHAENRNMRLGSRLHWFREQMVRAADPLSSQSLMRGSSSTSSLNEQDICALASGDFRNCLVTRFAMRPASQIEDIADDLSQPYRPQNAALLRVLSDAWMRRPMAETTANCAEGDPLCGLPPSSVFHDSNITAGDATRFPLADPHDQPEGTTLARTPRSAP